MILRKRDYVTVEIAVRSKMKLLCIRLTSLYAGDITY
jgi:hypothetical protein